MATLADLYGGQQATSDRGLYLDYVQACTEAGKKPLSPEDWVKAGKPKS